MQSNGLPRLVRDCAPTSSLEGLRQEIDRIDDALIDLIGRRLALSALIGKLKRSTPDRRLSFRPRRQASILERLKRRAYHLPPQLVTHVWGELMAHCLQAQIRTELVLCASRRAHSLKETVRERFGRAATAQWVATPAEALDIARRREAIAAIEYGPLDSWWTSLHRSDLAVFDLIRDESGRLVAIVVGRVDSEDMADGPRLCVLAEDELGQHMARGDAIDPISACGSLRLCLVTEGEAGR